MDIYDAPTAKILASQNRDPLLRHLTRTIVDLARAYAGREGRQAAIDIGCGVGRTSLALAEAGFEVVGVDPTERAVALAGRLAGMQPDVAGRIAFYVGDATAPAPLAWQGRFDLAVCSEVIEHVREPEAVVTYARDVLRPGGVLILTTPHDPAQWTAMDDYAAHVQRFTPEALRGLLWDFDLLELGTEGWPFQRAVMQAYDARLRRSGGEHRFEDFGESPAYRAYVRLMPWLLRLDHLFRARLTGTTLVAVARRRVLLA